MDNQKNWERAIVFVDMDAFFASIEQMDFPELKGKPICVTNGEQGTCMITCSYEARAYGLHTGMRLKEGRRLCPQLIQRASRPSRYAEISARIMHTLQDITPDVEVFSVDEAFLDVTNCQNLHGLPEHIARLTKEKVHQVSGLTCSVGVSSDKTTAKYAAKRDKPDGLTVIYPWDAEEELSSVLVTELSGISDGIGGFLASREVYKCGDMKKLPIGVLAKRFGNLGRRIWYMCQAQDPDKVITTVPDPKSIGHGKVMPPNTKDSAVVRIYLFHMAEKVCARLRRHSMQASQFFIGLKTEFGWLGGNFEVAQPTDDSRTIRKMCREVMQECWQSEGIYQVQITALHPSPKDGQFELFSEDTTQQDLLNDAIDRINCRYGDFTIAPAILLNRSSAPNVIAPAWKPRGHRKSV